MTDYVGSNDGIARLYRLQPPPGHIEFRLLACMTEKCAGDRFFATYEALAKHRLSMLDIMDAVRTLSGVYHEPIYLKGDGVEWGPFQ